MAPAAVEVSSGLKLPRFLRPVARLVSVPRSETVLGLLLLSYFLVLSGVVYDVIVEPPGIGSTQDPITGAVKPVAFLPYRINGQYIIEGLSAGFLFTLGGLGYVLLDWANDKTQPRRNRILLLISGAVSIWGAYSVCIVFLRIKIPGYLHKG
eukprot:jgi/Chlat1/1388/Chrsp12S01968